MPLLITALGHAIERRHPDFPGHRPRTMNAKPLRRSLYSTPSPHRTIREGRNINRLSFAYGVRHSLRAALPSDDHRCGGNLGFSEILVFTGFVITRANILSSLHSIRPHGSDFVAQGMLSYHTLHRNEVHPRLRYHA